MIIKEVIQSYLKNAPSFLNTIEKFFMQLQVSQLNKAAINTKLWVQIKQNGYFF